VTTVTVLAGERTVGGTLILVEDGGARLLLDCGLPFTPATNPFAHVRHRPGRVLADLLELELVPFVPGLYAPELLAGLHLPEGAPYDNQPGELAVVLSHSHLDHTHLVGFVDPSVPVYASHATARIVHVLAELGLTLGGLPRPITPASPDEVIAVGGMELRLLPVDHDVEGARGVLLETSDGVIAYPGDMRLHGLHPMLTIEFAQAARAAGARLLVLEGTMLRPPPGPDEPPLPSYLRVEADVVPDAMAQLEPGKLGVALLTPENGERVERFARAAAEAGRLFILDLEGFTLARAALGRAIEAPHGVYVPGDIAGRRPLPPSLSEALEAAPRVIQSREVAADPGGFLLRLEFASFADLLDLLPPKRGGVVIHANGNPLGPFHPGWPHLEWWVERLSMRLVNVGVTGHAHPGDLGLIATLSGARTVMSIHSRFPELAPVAPERLLLPERGRAYELAALGDGLCST
jgi:ribonuclease J